MMALERDGIGTSGRWPRMEHVEDDDDDIATGEYSQCDSILEGSQEYKGNSGHVINDDPGTVGNDEVGTARNDMTLLTIMLVLVLKMIIQPRL